MCFCEVSAHTTRSDDACMTVTGATQFLGYMFLHTGIRFGICRQHKGTNLADAPGHLLMRLTLRPVEYLFASMIC